MTEADRSFLKRIVYEETAQQLGVNISEINNLTIPSNVLRLLFNINQRTGFNLDISQLNSNFITVEKIISAFEHYQKAR